MDIIQCLLQFLQINESALTSSQSLHQSLNLNSLLLLAYMVVSFLTKRPSYMMAFFMSCMLFDMELFDPLSESELYAITFAIYSYLIFVMPCKVETTAACGIILISCITIGYDSYFYGVGGYYGARETFVYSNIECISLYAHIILIGSFINITRIRISLRDFIVCIRHMSRNSVSLMVM